MKNFAVLIGALFVSLAVSSAVNLGLYKPGDIITRDVAIIGGGASGTYAAVRLGDLNTSVVVIEAKDRLGGHTETYIDPATQIPVDIGVELYYNISVVNEFFGRFGVPLAVIDFGSTPVQWVDFRSGKIVSDFVPQNDIAIGEALAAYTAQLLKYPILDTGFFLPNPVPEDMLMPFGDFVKKYSLEAAVFTIHDISQQFPDLLNTPTLYVMMIWGLDLVANLEAGFLTTARHNNSEIYWNAQASLLPNLLLNSTVVNIDRECEDYVYIEVQTHNGQKLVQAKKLLITIPPLLNNLDHFDLSYTERHLFGQFNHVGYWTALTRNDGLSDDVIINNIGANTTYNLPVLPGLYTVGPTGVPGLHAIKYGAPSPVTLSNQQVQSDILSAIARLNTGGADPGASGNAEFAVFSSHTPYGLTVSTEAIKDGFYSKLYALQGERKTYWSGAAFLTHCSSTLWAFTEALLPELTV